MEVPKILALFVFMICCDCATLKNGLDDKPLTFEADGRYQFSYSLDDHARQESGELKRIGDAAVYVVTGSYSYIGMDGEVYKVNYVADENEFRIIPMLLGGTKATEPNLVKTLVD